MHSTGVDGGGEGRDDQLQNPCLYTEVVAATTLSGPMQRCQTVLRMAHIPVDRAPFLLTSTQPLLTFRTDSCSVDNILPNVLRDLLAAPARQVLSRTQGVIASALAGITVAAPIVLAMIVCVRIASLVSLPPCGCGCH